MFAKHPDVHCHSNLGIYRMLKLVSIKERSGLKVAYLIGKIIPPLKNEQPYSLAEVDKRLEATAFWAKCQRAGITKVPYEEILNLCDDKVKPDKKLFKRLQSMQKSGEDIKQYLTQLHMNGGSVTPKDVGGPYMVHFNYAATTMIQSIKATVADPNALKEVDQNIFNDLKTLLLDMGSRLEGKNETVSCSNGSEGALEVPKTISQKAA